MKKRLKRALFLSLITAVSSSVGFVIGVAIVGFHPLHSVSEEVGMMAACVVCWSILTPFLEMAMTRWEKYKHQRWGYDGMFAALVRKLRSCRRKMNGLLVA